MSGNIVIWDSAGKQKQNRSKRHGLKLGGRMHKCLIKFAREKLKWPERQYCVRYYSITEHMCEESLERG